MHKATFKTKLLCFWKHDVPAILEAQKNSAEHIDKITHFWIEIVNIRLSVSKKVLVGPATIFTSDRYITFSNLMVLHVSCITFCKNSQTVISNILLTTNNYLSACHNNVLPLFIAMTVY